MTIALILAALVPIAGGVASTAQPPEPSSELVKRAAAGDRRAFDELYRLHVAAAHRLLTRVVGPVPERDDLIQQVFLEAFRSLPKFRGEAAFSTWLHRIVIHVAYRHLRRCRRARFEEIPEDLSSSGSPEISVRQQQELVRALAFLSALKPDKRIAYVLRVVEGLSLDQIGALVGANAPAVGQRVKHAQRELDAMVERDRRRTRTEAS